MSNATGRQINVHDATIKTATVEVKALTISGKQVTLAVFRQLWEEPIINEETGDLYGVPWGVVNYHTSDCPGGEHRHVVWQKGGELRRATVRHPSDWVTRTEYYQRMVNKAHGIGTLWLAAATLTGWLPNDPANYVNRTERPLGYGKNDGKQPPISITINNTRITLNFTVDTWLATLWNESAFRAKCDGDWKREAQRAASLRECGPRPAQPAFNDKPWGRAVPAQTEEDHQEEVARCQARADAMRDEALKLQDDTLHACREGLIAALADHGFTPENRDNLIESVRATCSQMDAYEDRMIMRWREIEGLDQLFIAV